MNHYLLYYSGTYYIIHNHPTSPLGWIHWAASERIASVKTKSKREAAKALLLIAFIHWIEHSGNSLHSE